MLDFIVEFLLELVVQGMSLAAENKEVPKKIRYLLTGLILLLYMAVILFLLVLGYVLWNKHSITSFILIAIGGLIILDLVKQFLKNH